MKVEVSRDNKNLGAHQHSLKTERIHQRKQRQEQDVTKNMGVDTPLYVSLSDPAL